MSYLSERSNIYYYALRHCACLKLLFYCTNVIFLQRKSEHRRDDDSLVGVTEKIALVSQSSNRSSRDTKPKTKVLLSENLKTFQI